ncbi:MAG: radical SAM protein [Pseudomonadota bacterium]
MAREIFHLILIKPTKYDADGYPIQFFRSSMPSNALASVHGLAEDCRQRAVLGPDTEIVLHAMDENNTVIPHGRLIRQIRRDGGKALLALVGVQSNQFPRAVDLAQPFLDAGVPVCMGGFHVSGCMAMLKEMPPEMEAAQAKGISFFLGEAEECRLDQVIQDAAAGRLQPVYDYKRALPTLEGQPVPFLNRDVVAKSNMVYSSFDLGRGCPFECSFCCIINVQGRKSRFRTPDDLEHIIRINQDLGITRFFVTDDNFARNKNWEALLDRLIELKERHGLDFTLIIQVDTLCHRTPRFIEKCVRAGVDQVFIGLENINPDNLASSQKRQNRITEYREMLLAWKEHPVVLTAGYIIGFPNDTRESILRDIDVVKEELPIDILSMTVLTPLPGSEDHFRAVKAGTWMDPDLNKYDLTQTVTQHPNFAPGELDAVFREAYDRYYTPEHCETVLRRAAALGSTKPMTTAHRLLLYGTAARLYNIYSLDGGMIRIKSRRERRPGLPRESWLRFYPSYWWQMFSLTARLLLLRWYYLRLTRRLWTDPARHEYRDTAITPPEASEFDELDLFKQTRGGEDAVKMHHKRAGLNRIAKAGSTDDAAAIPVLQRAP